MKEVNCEFKHDICITSDLAVIIENFVIYSDNYKIF